QAADRAVLRRASQQPLGDRGATHVAGAHDDDGGHLKRPESISGGCSPRPSGHGVAARPITSSGSISPRRRVFGSGPVRSITVEAAPASGPSAHRYTVTSGPN